MIGHDAAFFGKQLRRARSAAGMKQRTLSLASGIARLRLVRLEKGLFVPRLDEAIRISAALKIPLEIFASGHWVPSLDLRGIAFELNHYGICDIEVSDPVVPGSFRCVEQVIAAALMGDRPEPRVVEAIPALLARQKFNVTLLVAFANIYDKRIRNRLAWLSDITLTLQKQNALPMKIRSENRLSRLTTAEKSEKPDSLGHPTDGRLSPIWKRWNITYASQMMEFKERLREVESAYQKTRISLKELE